MSQNGNDVLAEISPSGVVSAFAHVPGSGLDGVTLVPEPASLAMVGVALASRAGYAWRWRKAVV